MREEGLVCYSNGVESVIYRFEEQKTVTSRTSDASFTQHGLSRMELCGSFC